MMLTSVKKILIVEDDAIAALALQIEVNGWGYPQCHTVSSGEEAIKWATKESPDVILMDVNLREARDGVQIALEINALLPCHVIFLSGYPKSEIEARYDPTLPFKCMSKPTNRDLLKKMVDNLPVDSSATS